MNSISMQLSTISFEHKSFDELNTSELYSIMRLRQKVFVVEQDCAYLDADDLDQEAIHVIGSNLEGTILAYARILASGTAYETYASIGRIITASQARGIGLGKPLMEKAISICLSAHPQTIKISAQVYALGFYEKLGFVPIGKEYLEDGIPHIGMVLERN